MTRHAAVEVGRERIGRRESGRARDARMVAAIIDYGLGDIVL